MSRLLHAAARGARLQTKWTEAGSWQTTSRRPCVGDTDFWQVHPDDEHLQYGPISTALRDHVLSYAYGCVFSAARGYLIALQHDWVRDAVKHSETADDRAIDFQMTMLFAAEYLADEGL